MNIKLPGTLVPITASLLLGCGTPGAPLPPSLELPVQVQDLAAARKGDQVYLSWTAPQQTTDRQLIRHPSVTRICRGLELAMTQCGTPVGEVPGSPVAPLPRNQPPPKITASFVDSLSPALEREHPTGTATYAVEALSRHGRSAGLSNQVQVPLAPTLPPPDDLKAQLTPDGVVLSWSLQPTGEEPQLSYRYRVYRQLEASPGKVAIGEVAPGSSPQATLVDRTFEWEKTYLYRVAVVTGVALEEGRRLEVEGADSAPARVVAHDIYPPATPTGVQAVFSGVGQQPFVDLTWAPNTEADLAGYHVYRRPPGGAPQKINTELVKTNSFRDAHVEHGTRYLYSVLAVDVRGNESPRSAETSEQVP